MNGEGPDSRIVLTGLLKRYGERAVVDNVSASVEKGEIVGLLGPNGAGKTTTFYMVVGLVKPDGGSVALERDGDDVDLTHAPMYVRARSAIGYLAQENSIFRKLSVGDNIRLIWEMNGVPRAEQDRRLPASSTSSACARSWTRAATACRAASGGASRSRAPSRTSPRSYSSTSRSRASIPSPSPTFKS